MGGKTMTIGTGVGIRMGMEHRDGQGHLIYAEYTRASQRAVDYDTWRSNWCNKHRTDETPEGLREGLITVENLEFAIKRGYKPVFSIEQLVDILNT